MTDLRSAGITSLIDQWTVDMDANTAYYMEDRGIGPASFIESHQ